MLCILALGNCRQRVERAVSGRVTVPVASPTPDATPPVSPTIPIYRVGDGVTPPRLIEKVEPRFPKECRKVRLDGTLFMFEAVISEQGNVLDVQTIRRPKVSPPCVTLEASFRQAIERWKYQPAMLEGRPVRVYLTVTVNIHV